MATLLRLLILQKMLEQQQGPPPGLEYGGGHCGCGCGERIHDLDDMNDLDDGHPYLWN